MKVSEIINAARSILQDANGPYRWTDDFMRNALDDGILLLHSETPSTRYVDGAYRDRVELPRDNDEDFPIADRYRVALAYYVVSRCYEVDDADTANAQLAESYRAKSTQRMKL